MDGRVLIRSNVLLACWNGVIGGRGAISSYGIFWLLITRTLIQDETETSRKTRVLHDLRIVTAIPRLRQILCKPKNWSAKFIGSIDTFFVSILNVIIIRYYFSLYQFCVHIYLFNLVIIVWYPLLLILHLLYILNCDVYIHFDLSGSAACLFCYDALYNRVIP